MAAFAACAAALAGWFPIQLSVAAVFLFSGPHNWMEARYFAGRMPVRWAHQRTFFLIAIAGVVLLSATYSLIAVNRSVWHSAAAIWALTLIWTSRREAFSLALPLVLFWMALAWAASGVADIILVFLHPLAALWFVHRQIARTRPAWLSSFRVLALAIVPLAIGVVLMRGNNSDSTAMTVSFAGAAFPPAMLALHAFLELLHYGAWIIVLPAIGLASAPWDFTTIPLVRHRRGWPRLTTLVLLAGGVAVLVLWICFAVDYRTTRDIYFTLAIVHVMAEVPFLAWLR